MNGYGNYYRSPVQDDGARGHDVEDSYYKNNSNQGGYEKNWSSKIMRNSNNNNRYQKNNQLSPSKYNDYSNSNNYNNNNIHMNNGIINNQQHHIHNNINHHISNNSNSNSNNNNNNVNHNININNIQHSPMRDHHTNGILSGSGGIVNTNNSNTNNNSNPSNNSNNNIVDNSSVNNDEASRIYDPEYSWYELDMRGCGIRSISPEIKNYGFLTAIYLSNNRLTSLPEEIFSDMKSLMILDLSYNSIPKIPIGVTYLITLEKLYLQENRIVELPLEMGRLFKLKELNVSGNPIISPSQSILQSSTEYVISYLRDRMPMPPPPPERRFISYLSEGKNTKETLPELKDKFRVLSYNILAEQYAPSERYPYCPSWALSWNYRKQGIIKEILSYESDVICLQEVESLQFSEFFQVELEKLGYEGIFCPKSRARTMEDWGVVDGCATFYKKSKFTLVKEHFVEYQSISISKHKEISEEVFSRIITKDNIAIVVVLQLKDDVGNESSPSSSPTSSPSPSPSPGKSNNGGSGSNNGRENGNSKKNRSLLVANTHIHWNPDNKDVKLFQVQLLLDYISSITNTKSKWNKIPMIIAGDFNSSTESGPYELLSKGFIKPKHPDLEGFDYGHYSSNGMKHAYSLSSAYAPIGEPSFTNYTGDFIGVLDYLWFTQDSLAVSKVLQPIDEETLRFTKLPNAYMYSDHISLVSEFYFKK